MRHAAVRIRFLEAAGLRDDCVKVRVTRSFLDFTSAFGHFDLDEDLSLVERYSFHIHREDFEADNCAAADISILAPDRDFLEQAWQPSD